MLKIRLQRVGRVHEPTFRIVVTDARNSTKSGRALEVLGSHDPRDKSKTILNVERVKHWVSVGAQPTITMHNMLVSKKIIEGKKLNALPKKRPQKSEAEQQAQSNNAAQPSAEQPAETPATQAPVTS